MNKTEHYRQELKNTDDWDSYLINNSGLPGRRANIELARAVALEGNADIFEYYISYNEDLAPTNSPNEFLAFCGTLGLGTLLKTGELKYLGRLRELSNDSRWRIREAVAMALQNYGEEDMDSLLKEMSRWANGSRLEQRAAAAALCEPGLLSQGCYSQSVFQILNEITDSLQFVEDHGSENFKALRKGLGYCWSVAVAAYPGEGKVTMERWFSVEDKDIRWIMKENLKKKRLMRIDPQWTEKWKERLK
jgi:hypothetical protein